MMMIMRMMMMMKGEEEEGEEAEGRRIMMDIDGRGRIEVALEELDEIDFLGICLFDKTCYCRD